MRIPALKSVILGTALTLLTSPAIAKSYSPEALVRVIQRTAALTAQGKQAVVMFDLDDTLVNTRERTLRILRDMASNPQFQQQFPSEAQKILSLQVPQLKFLLGDTLNSIGITDADFIKKANDFWFARFFTDAYCALDQPNPGAAKYLNLLARAGAKIVYLTGRDTPRMGKGTAANLIRNRFPTESTGAVLILKPDTKQDDLKFKESQYASVAALGQVVGAFENEPANIYSMADAFPQAEAIFLDTIHSPNPVIPEDRLKRVKDRVKTVKDFNF